MKKFMIFLMATSAIALSSKSQDSKYYLKAGINMANISTTQDASASSLTSFHAGFMADFPLSKLLSVQPGLLFTGKGSKLEIGKPDDATYFKNTVNPYYIEIPVNLIANIPLVDGESKFFIGAGLYGAAGVAGKYKNSYKTLAGTINAEDKIKFTSDAPSTSEEVLAGLGRMNRWDYGINGTAGFAFKNLLISINYGHGLANLYTGTTNSSSDKYYNRVWSLTFGVSL
ncbi:porin family protein [Flavihumibacter profundi]|uniref:porin family protein n=1 Tax=Flavihumibacter profundi TaxID=2716883 RepID=UPI001CC3A378|nr:porin family protein [Flavihumibacter profundi]MBZ5858800.1 PorT family protein [Flavihumibacter profundi]